MSLMDPSWIPLWRLNNAIYLQVVCAVPSQIGRRSRERLCFKVFHWIHAEHNDVRGTTPGWYALGKFWDDGQERMMVGRLDWNEVSVCR